MTTYTEVFGNSAVPPAGNAFVSASLTADTVFYWPELATGANLVADIMEVSSDAPRTMTLPAANAVSVGRNLIVRNVGSFTITVNDASGGTITTVSAGGVKYLYIETNVSVAGTWGVFTFGSGTSSADASALAGFGLTVVGSTLAQEYETVTTSANYTVASSNRAQTLIFSGSGAVTCSMLSSAAAGNGFFLNLSNQGSGMVTIDPNSTETVDGAATKDLAPGESATLVCDGTNWVTIGYGRSTVFQFTKLVLDITGGGPFTLTSAQAQNKLIQFIGVAPAAVTVNIPAVVAVYYLQGSYTGAYALTFKTVTGSGITLTGSDRSIAYCDGTDVVLAQTAATPAANLSGGVAGAIPWQQGVGLTSFTAAGSANQVLISNGTSSPSWTNLSVITQTYSGKTTPVDGDAFPLYDSAATTTGTKLLWSSLKATLKTYFDTLYATVTSGTSILKGDGSGGFSNAVAGTDYLAPAAIGVTVQAYDADTMKSDVETDITGAMTHTPSSLTDGANIDWNLDAQQNATVTLGGNRVMNAPSNAKAGRYVGLRVVQDGTGGRTLTFASAYKGMTGITPVTSASAVNFYLFRCIDTTNLALVGFRANCEA